MTSEIRPQTAFAPLPVKARTTLEVLDISVKLYRRYFGVLTLWALIVGASYIVNAFVGFATILTMPLMYGAASCALAAAVRGQKITFNQVWEFTKPRFGALIGMILLSYVILTGIVLVIMLVGGLLAIGVAAVVSDMPSGVQAVAIIIGILLGLTLWSVLMVLSFGWLNMVPIVICMEDDKRGIASLSRAWNLISGHWRRVTTITVLLGLSILIVFGIVAGFCALLFGFGSFLTSAPSETAILGFVFGFTFLAALFAVFWTPAQTIVIAVLYLDLRVRKEALDLEWSSYSTAPDQIVSPQSDLMHANLQPALLSESSNQASAEAVMTNSESTFANLQPPSSPFTNNFSSGSVEQNSASSNLVSGDSNLASGQVNLDSSDSNLASEDITLTKAEPPRESAAPTVANLEATEPKSEFASALDDFRISIEKPNLANSETKPTDSFPTSSFGVPNFEIPDAPREEKA